ncbi:hypothetical protein [Caulobacter endophyticus]|uniref:Uncharacterized protein n=1 Tax=Caulobacter endophyticus TaxID=2172652 RepID=A0A2T9JI67_9CAUL|nr:hypothetical protein [Caulobacter endophyticus]PVM83387.1 hypothetical protein DDF67_20825 [Caulobacter endophyticus]
MTGKRIRFRFEQAYSTTADRREGPHLRLRLLYKIDDLEPVLAGPPGDQHMGPSRASATVRGWALGGDLTPATIAQAKGAFGTIGAVPPGSLVLRPDL